MKKLYVIYSDYHEDNKVVDLDGLHGFLEEVLGNDDSYEFEGTGEELAMLVGEECKENGDCFVNGFAITLIDTFENVGDMAVILENIDNEEHLNYSGYFIQDLEEDLDEIFWDYDEYKTDGANIYCFRLH